MSDFECVQVHSLDPHIFIIHCISGWQILNKNEGHIIYLAIFLYSTSGHMHAVSLNGRSHMKTVGGSSLRKEENLARILYIYIACNTFCLVVEGAFDSNGSCELVLFFHIVRFCLVASLF